YAVLAEQRLDGGASRNQGRRDEAGGVEHRPETVAGPREGEAFLHRIQRGIDADGHQREAGPQVVGQGGRSAGHGASCGTAPATGTGFRRAWRRWASTRGASSASRQSKRATFCMERSQVSWRLASWRVA